MVLQVGQQAPGFSLYNTEKTKVSLEGFRGQNVVLLFFPLAFSSVCTAEMCSVRDNLGSFNKLQATVLGISVDSLYTLAKFREQQQLNFMLLSDFNKKVSEAYGVLYPTFAYDMQGVSKRAAFVLNKDGVILYAEVLENPGNQPDFSAIQKVLQNLVPVP